MGDFSRPSYLLAWRLSCNDRFWEFKKWVELMIVTRVVRQRFCPDFFDSSYTKTNYIIPKIDCFERVSCAGARSSLAILRSKVLLFESG